MASYISSIDKKGRILIPLSIRKELEIALGEKVMVSSSPKDRTIAISALGEKRLLSLCIELSDKPGSLAKAALTLYELGVDIVSSRSRFLKRGEKAVWEVECKPNEAKIMQIKSALAKCGARLERSLWK
jgi:AbrB family looped-hinge helix DNA binding protein